MRFRVSSQISLFLKTTWILLSVVKLRTILMSLPTRDLSGTSITSTASKMMTRMLRKSSDKSTMTPLLPLQWPPSQPLLPLPLSPFPLALRNPQSWMATRVSLAIWASLPVLTCPADGDTTEEDEPEPIVRRKTRRPSKPMSDISDSDADSPVKAERGQPRLGRYNLDRSDKKPIAVLNPVTGKMMIFTPHRRHQLDLSPEQFNFPWGTEGPESPIMSNSANLMLSAMFSSNTFGDFFNTAQVMGPAEAFFPFPSEPNTADESSTAPSLQDEEEEDAELNLDLNDFIAWEENDSSGDEEGDNWDPASTPARPSTATSEKQAHGHINSETVGAFRRNQINQQLILSNQATQDSLAFSGPYNYTALKGLKSDRFDTAAIPLTPARRHKRQMSDATRSPLESMSQKRKATTEAGNGHKRHRSISDVNYLHI
ncbi:hypothetical protein V3481_015019 [Fusarium oxysporum f. sp. vasinfectum]